MLQGVFAAMTDIALFSMTRNLFDEATAWWALFCHVTSWFNFYCLVRPFSNSLETLLTTLALMYWPWPSIRRKQKTRFKALCFAAMAVIIRPTSVVLWLYLGLNHLLFHCQDRVRLIVAQVLPIMIVAIITMLSIDYIGYGEWVIVPLNFFRFNVLDVSDDSLRTFVSNFVVVGKEPFIWYTSMALVLFKWFTIYYRHNVTFRGFGCLCFGGMYHSNDTTDQFSSYLVENQTPRVFSKSFCYRCI